MKCPGCILGYMLSHPEERLAKIYRKCQTCGFCAKSVQPDPIVHESPAIPAADRTRIRPDYESDSDLG